MINKKKKNITSKKAFDEILNRAKANKISSHIKPLNQEEQSYVKNMGGGK